VTPAQLLFLNFLFLGGTQFLVHIPHPHDFFFIPFPLLHRGRLRFSMYSSPPFHCPPFFQQTRFVGLSFFFFRCGSRGYPRVFWGYLSCFFLRLPSPDSPPTPLKPPPPELQPRLRASYLFAAKHFLSLLPFFSDLPPLPLLPDNTLSLLCLPGTPVPGRAASKLVSLAFSRLESIPLCRFVVILKLTR